MMNKRTNLLVGAALVAAGLGLSRQAQAIIQVGQTTNVSVSGLAYGLSDAYLIYGNLTNNNSDFQGGAVLLNNGNGLNTGVDYSVHTQGAAPGYYGLVGVYTIPDPQTGITLGVSSNTATTVAENQTFSTFFPEELGYFQFPNSFTDSVGGVPVTVTLNPLTSISETDMVGNLQALATGSGTINGVSGTYTIGNVTVPFTSLPAVQITNFTFDLSTTATVVNNIKNDLIASGSSGDLVNFSNGTAGGNFSVTPTPEPGAMWLLAAAGVPLLLRKKRLA